MDIQQEQEAGEPSTVKAHSVRRATKFDISELLRLAWSGYKEMEFFNKGIEYDVSAVSKLTLSIIDSERVGCVFVVESPTKEGRLLGRIIAIKNPLFHNPSVMTAHVLGIFVDRKYRGHGIGKLLLAAAMEWAKSENIGIFIAHHRTTSGDGYKKTLVDNGFEPFETMYFKVV